MSTFACRNCGSTDELQVLEMTPRHRSISVVADASGKPVEGDDAGDGTDELFYEASEFRAYRCDRCGSEYKSLDQLVAAR